MSNKLFYPALFQKTVEGFYVSFPDFPECAAKGNNIELAFEMASNALEVAISNKLQSNVALPEASSFDDVSMKKESFLAIIEFDKLAYNKKHNSKAVKKTLSIPEWLNEEALAAGVNFSQVLQEALIQRISE